MTGTAPASRPFEIVTVDSPRAAVLRRRARPVRSITGDITELIDRMFLTLAEARGLGLAAPQVGVGKRVLVATVGDRRLAMVDPEITKREGEEIATEACLSIPGLLGDVPRATHIVVRARNRRNRRVTVEAEGLLARVLQHEIDHLDGVLFPERVRDPKTLRRAAEATAEVAPPGTESAGAPPAPPSGTPSTGTPSTATPSKENGPPSEPDAPSTGDGFAARSGGADPGRPACPPPAARAKTPPTGGPPDRGGSRRKHGAAP